MRTLSVCFLLTLLATGLKVWWAATSMGTTDTQLFFEFGRYLQTHSLLQAYREQFIFNHMPFTGYLARGLYVMAEGEMGQFAFLLRWLCALADVGTMVGLGYLFWKTGRPPGWALAAMAVNPVFLMVSGFHCQVDPILVCFLFLAALAAWAGSVAWSAILFALACSVKISPLIAAPIFFFYWWARSRKAALNFFGIYSVCMLLAMAEPLLAAPLGFARNVLGYSSMWGVYGITYLLVLTKHPEFQTVWFYGPSDLVAVIVLCLKITFTALTLTLAWRRRKLASLGLFESLAAMYAIFFVFTPGAFIHYMTWFAPFALVAAPRWWVGLTAAASCFLFAFYHQLSGGVFPWDFADTLDQEGKHWVEWSLAPFGVFIAYLLWNWRRWFLLRTGEPTEEAAEQDPTILAS